MQLKNGQKCPVLADIDPDHFERLANTGLSGNIAGENFFGMVMTIGIQGCMNQTSQSCNMAAPHP